MDTIKRMTGWTVDEIAEEFNNTMDLDKPVHHIGLFNFRGAPWYENLIKVNGEYFTILDKSTGRMQPMLFMGNETDYKRLCI